MSKTSTDRSPFQPVRITGSRAAGVGVGRHHGTNDAEPTLEEIFLDYYGEPAP